MRPARLRTSHNRRSRFAPLVSFFEPVLPVCARHDAHRMHRLDSGVLLKLKGGQWTIGGPDFRGAVLHAVERPLPDAGRWFESLDRHGVRSVVSAAFHDG